MPLESNDNRLQKFPPPPSAGRIFRGRTRWRWSSPSFSWVHRGGRRHRLPPFLDVWLHTKPAMMIVFGVIGFVAASATFSAASPKTDLDGNFIPGFMLNFIRPSSATMSTTPINSRALSRFRKMGRPTHPSPRRSRRHRRRLLLRSKLGRRHLGRRHPRLVQLPLAAARTRCAHHRRHCPGQPACSDRDYFKALFRYGLIALAVYVIFKYLNVPILSMICGCVPWERPHWQSVCTKSCILRNSEWKNT